MAESHNHHYIPQGYLRGFGWKRGKHHMVVVHDFQEKKTYETNTCGRRGDHAEIWPVWKC